MAKRKREAPEAVENGVPSLDYQRKIVGEQIELGKKALVRNLKLAKGFERQKLGRRQKDALAKNDTAANARIEAEIDALKKFNVQTAAEHHLYKTLLKTKSIASTNTLPIQSEDLLKISLVDTATSNITARLYNTKVVKDSLSATLRGIRVTLKLKEPDNVESRKKVKKGEGDTEELRPTKQLKVDREQNNESEQTKKEQTITEEKEPREIKESKSKPPKSTPTPSQTIASELEEEEFRGFSDWSEPDNPFKSVSGTGIEGDDESGASDYNSEDFAAFDARLASSDDEDDSDIEDLRATSAAQLKRELAEAVSKPGKFAVQPEPTIEEADLLATSEVEASSANESRQASKSSIPLLTDPTSVIEAFTLDTMLTQWPPKTVDVAKRMIHAHLGIRLPGTLKKSSSGEESSASDTNEIMLVNNTTRLPTDELSPVDGTSSVDENKIVKKTDFLTSTLGHEMNGTLAIGVDIATPKLSDTTAGTTSSILRNDTKRRSSDWELTPTNSDSEIPSTVPNTELPKKKTKVKPNVDTDSESEEKSSPKLRPRTSAFLPSLTIGGYWSGSESEPSDVEEHVAPRKNRRGQRARQAIAEAKFGAAAKHLKDGPVVKKTKDARDQGWDMKRGATNAEDERGFKGMNRKERRGRMDGAHKAGASGGNAIPIGSGKNNFTVVGAEKVEKPLGVKPKRDDLGPLHPSWEAKRNAKASVGKIVPFQGKKITFD